MLRRKLWPDRAGFFHLYGQTLFIRASKLKLLTDFQQHLLDFNYMKLVINALCFFTFNLASGAKYEVQGKVSTLRDNANDIWGADADFLLLAGVSSAGRCKKVERASGHSTARRS